MRACFSWLFRAFVPFVLLVMSPQVQADPDRLLDRLERERTPGFVFDFAGVMAANERRAVESVLAELEQKTGAQVKMVTLSSLEGGEINDFANRLMERWGIGRKDHDDGVLLLAAMEERRVRIEIGYGLEPVLPDAKTGRILDRYVMPAFRSGQPGRGLVSAAAVLAGEIASDAGVSLSGVAARAPPAREGSGRPHPLLLLLGAIIFIPLFIRHPFLALLLLSGGRGGRGFGGGGFGGGGFGGGFGGGLSGGGGATRGW